MPQFSPSMIKNLSQKGAEFLFGEVGMSHRFTVSVDLAEYDLGSWSRAVGLSVNWEMSSYWYGESDDIAWISPGKPTYPKIKLSRAACSDSATVRLQRARHSRTFLNMKDSDIARQVASRAGLTVGGAIEETRATHDHVAQVNQTDWEFLAWRARAIGYEFGMSGGEFYFRKASSASGQSTPLSLAYPELLRGFWPRVSAGNLGTETEVRVWDPLAAKVVSSTARTSTGSVALSTDPARLAATFGAATPPAPAATNPALGDLGPAPTEDGHVMSSWPLAVGAAIDPAASEALAGVAEHVGSTFAEADGEAIGDPRLLAGAVLDISGMPDQFNGKWVITGARHVLDAAGYHTHFTVSGRQERSLLGLASGGASRPAAPRIAGLVCGIVSNVGDPQKLGRVKVTLAWLSPGFESDWAGVVQVGAGLRSGAVFLPEVGDEVMVGFEFGDPHRPYVLGGLLNSHSAVQLGGAPVETTGETAEVVWRGYASPTGNRLAFHDQLPPGEGSPKASDLVLGTRNANLALAIDQVAGTVTLTCKPAAPESKSAAGHLSIVCGDNGTIDITTGQGGTVNIDAGAQLAVKAQTSVKIESSGAVEIKGNPIKLN